MPVLPGGDISKRLRGKDQHDAILNKCQEMRRELRHLEGVVGRIEAMARRQAPLDTFGPQLSLMFNWQLSFMESFMAVAGASVGREKVRAAIADFTRRFANFHNT